MTSTSLKSYYPKPVFCLFDMQIIDGMSYLLGCGCDEIFTFRDSQIAPINVQLSFIKDYLQKENEGIKEIIVFAGEFKTSRFPECPLTENQKAHLQHFIDQKFEELTLEIKKFRPQFIFSKENLSRQYALNMLEDKMIDGIIDDQIELTSYILKKLGYDPIKDFVNLNFIIKDREVKEKTSDVKNKIAVVEINTLDRLSSWYFLHKLYFIFSKPEIKSIIFSINSSGGDSVLHKVIQSQILKLKAMFNKPAITLIDNTACSGGYLLSTVSEHIISSSQSRLGHIGTYQYFKDISEKNKKDKIEYFAIKPKDISVYDKNLPFDDIKKNIAQSIVDLSHADFKSLIKKNRPQISADESKWAEAQLLTPQEAKELGLIDAIGTKIDALKYLIKGSKLMPHQFSVDIYNLETPIAINQKTVPLKWYKKIYLGLKSLL